MQVQGGPVPSVTPSRLIISLFCVELPAGRPASRSNHSDVTLSLFLKYRAAVYTTIRLGGSAVFKAGNCLVFLGLSSPIYSLLSAPRMACCLGRVGS